MRWESTTATMVIKTTSTINQLLLTQVSELSIFNQIVRLNASNRRESPAAATMSLIFDGAYTIVISPVPVGRDVL